MGFLDEIKNKMHLGGQQGYDQGYGQDDDYGYDDGYDDGYQNNGYSGASPCYDLQPAIALAGDGCGRLSSRCLRHAVELRREHACPRCCPRTCSLTERCLGVCEQHHQRYAAAAGLCPAPREL